jgi:fatty-acyl-CoA synthase
LAPIGVDSRIGEFFGDLVSTGASTAPAPVEIAVPRSVAARWLAGDAEQESDALEETLKMSNTIVRGFSSTSNKYVQLNTSTFIRSAATSYPEVEVVSRRSDGSLFRYNYAQAHERMRRMANALIAEGVRPGDRVAIMEFNTHRFWELYHAVSGIGAVIVQVNLRVSAEERVYVLNHAKPSMIFVAEPLLGAIESIADQLESVKKYAVISERAVGQIGTAFENLLGYEELVASHSPDHDWAMIDENAAAAACYTSGTTGRPKGVFYSHRAFYLHTMAMGLTINLSNRDVMMQTVPMFHANGWGLFYAAAAVGAKLVFPGPYSADNLNPLVDLMLQEKVTVNQGAPAILMPVLTYLQSLEKKPVFDNLRILSGATEPPLSMMKGFAEFGVEIIHAYGATETAPLVSCNLSKATLAHLPEEEKWEMKKKQGLVICGVEVKIADPEGNPIEPGSGRSGEVLIRGPWITESYHDQPGSEDSFTEDGYWRSGDAGMIDEYGYLKITDRFKDLIKSGGEWISSIDLENALMAHPAVAEASVVGIPHPKWQERPLALVVLKKGKAATAAELLGSLTPPFAKWQLPDEVLFVNEIPKTSVGKFSKKAVREQYLNHYQERA